MKLVLFFLLVSLLSTFAQEDDQVTSLDENFPEENPGLFEGDIDFWPGENPFHRNAIANNHQLWPGGVIPYVVDSSHTGETNLMESAMNEIMAKTKVNGRSCITFTPRTHERSYIRFITGSGCHTPIGYRSNHISDVTLGRGCLRHGTIMHEILHSLGFWHEQSRADRDNYVTINWSNIQHGHENNFNKYHLGTQVDHLGMPYDYGSVMHYSAYAFAVDRRIRTIVPKDSHAVIGQRTRLSDQDAKEIQILYGCIPRPNSHSTMVSHGATTTASPTNHPSTNHHVTATYTPHPTPVITHVTSNPHTVLNGATTCEFEHSLCGWTQSHTDDLDWSFFHGRTPSPNTGPHADRHNNATASYLYLEASNHFSKTATLLSPIYNAGQWCVRAYFHMYGSHTGYLRFYAIHGSHKLLMHTYRGNHGDRWLHATFSLHMSGTLPFQIEIEGHTGNGYTSDIAVDDVSITPGHCTH